MRSTGPAITSHPAERQWALEGHTGPVGAVCAVPVGGGRTLVASGGDDRTVRIWDPGDNGRMLKAVHVHHAIRALAFASGALVAGLSAGLLALEFPELTSTDHSDMM
jgi:WD40 repeat protein